MAERRYTWHGINRQGHTVKGDMQADSPQTVTQRLREQRIRATHVQRQYELPTWLHLRAKSSTSTRDIAQLTRQLATLIHAGVPLLQAFQILERSQNNTALRTLIQILQQRIEGAHGIQPRLARAPAI